MPPITDIVCRMTLDSDAVTERSAFQGTTFFFCSSACRVQFEANPALYAARGGPSDVAHPADSELERHEAPYTRSGGIVAPKFGSAGSGGLEHERGPERHKDR